MPSTLAAPITAHHDALPLLSYRDRRRAAAEGRRPTGPALLVHDGETARLVELADGVTHVGRGFTATLPLDDASVSRRHATFVREGSRVRVLDDRSTNGTWVNGRRVFGSLLNDGDVLLIGAVELTFVFS